MSLERIDPLRLEDYYAVDHLLRYLVVAELARGKKVLDAACGLGFGSVILLHHGADRVVGMDNSSHAIGECRRRWKNEGLTFRQMDLCNPDTAENESFGLVTSFETLEHVPDPDRAIKTFADLLEPEGHLVGSVPGETDWLEDNEHHHHRFSPNSLRELIGNHFPHVLIYRQEFRIQSAIRDLGERCPDVLSRRSVEEVEIDFGAARPVADSLFFIASSGDLPSINFAVNATSRQAWQLLRSNNRQLQEQLDSVSEKFRTQFLELGDLKVKFSNMFGWAKWHYEQSTGEKPSGEALDRVMAIATQREGELIGQVHELQEENRKLRRQIEELREPAEFGLKARASFLDESARKLDR